MSNTDEQARRRFQPRAECFDAICAEDKEPVAWSIDELWRGVVRKPLDVTLENLAPLNGRSISARRNGGQLT